MNIEDYKYKTELHAHTYPISGCASLSVERMIEVNKEKGVDAVALTNHFYQDKNINHYLDAFHTAREYGQQLGVTVILGMEYYGSGHDYLVYGIDEDFVWAAHKYASGNYDEFYDNMKNDKNVIVHAHPFREPWRDLGDDRLDGIEVFNLHPGHNSRVGLAARYFCEHGLKIPIIGSDFHHEKHYVGGLLLTKTLPRDSFELAEILKSRDYLFDISGNVVIPYGFCEAE